MHKVMDYIYLKGVRSIDKSVVIEYKKELCKRYAVKSVNSILSSINAFFLLKKNPNHHIMPIMLQRHI